MHTCSVFKFQEREHLYSPVNSFASKRLRLNLLTSGRRFRGVEDVLIGREAVKSLLVVSS